MGITDLIAAYILATLAESEGQVELRRVGLAEQFQCAPSQINYVCATRFSPERGYLVESRRGGGGYIRITQMRQEPGELLMHTINAVGDHLDLPSANAFLANLSDTLPDMLLSVLAAALSENALRPVPPEYRPALRAQIFKQCLLAVKNGQNR